METGTEVSSLERALSHQKELVSNILNNGERHCSTNMTDESPHVQLSFMS